MLNRMMQYISPLLSYRIAFLVVLHKDVHMHSHRNVIQTLELALLIL